MSPNSSPKPLVYSRMTSVAEKDCVINPSFSKFTGNEGVEDLFLTKEVEDPGLVKVRAMVGCRSIHNENPMLIDMRQVPGVSFLIQPEPALISKGQGIISLFSCSLNSIKINKGDVIAECAEGYYDHYLAAIHNSMRLLNMQSLFLWRIILNLFKVIQHRRSLGDHYSSMIIPKTVPIIRASLSSPPPIEPLPGSPPTSLYSSLAPDSDNISNSESTGANSEDSGLQIKLSLL